MVEDNNTEYINFIQNENSLFYGNDKTDSEENSKFELPDYDSQAWHNYTTPYWTYMIGKEHLPDQGWKIHITANVNDAQEELMKVSRFLIGKGVSFKFIPNKAEFILRNSKYGSRVESGKFITVYPSSEKQFVELLSQIEKITNGFEEGPYILNDMQWHDSNVFFRYGAFKRMEMFIDGTKVMAIKRPDGTLTEDRRVPYFYLPDFVILPDKVKKDNKQLIDPHTFDQLKKYKITNALHYSNAGGVYLATKDKEKLVLKEGRPYAGIDAEGLDGFSRIKGEYQVLQKLSDIPEVVNVKAYFRAWKHNYLCEEYVSGEPLIDYIVQNYPTDTHVSNYVNSMEKILNKLVITLKKIHELGIAIGDLQPANILINEDGTQGIDIRIIDLESAHLTTDAYNPGLATPGYVNLCSSSYSSADWFALYRISRYAFLPIETGTDLAPEIEVEQDKNIREHFGNEVVDLMRNIKGSCFSHIFNGYKPPYYKECLKKPKNTFSMKNIKKNIDDLYRGIRNNLDYDSIGLIKGDIRQYDSDICQYSIANGAFGGIMGMERSKELGSQEKIKVLNWIERNLGRIKELAKDEQSDKGLYTGLSGISAPLFEMGYEDEAESLLKKVSFDKSSADVSIYSGLSGIGLANLAMYRQVGDVDFLDRAKKIGSRISKLFNGDTTNSGLLTGWLGAALFLWKLFLEINDKKIRERGIQILDTVIEKEIVKTNTGIYLKDDNLDYQRLMPYLNRGSAGLGYLILKIKNDDPGFIGSKYDNLLDGLLETTDVYITYMDCLFDGMSGLIAFDQLADSLMGKQYGNLNLKIRLLNNYMIGQGEETLVPGKFGYKCSMDVDSGAAGVLLVLSDVYHETYESWLPILRNN